MGKVTFVAGDIVLGQQGSASAVRNLLDRMEAQTLVVDLAVDDLEGIDDGEPEDPFLRGTIGAVEEVAEEPPLEAYRSAVDWARTAGIDLRPIGSRSHLGWIQARRVRKAMTDVDNGNPETRARTALQEVLADDRVGPLAKRRRQDLADSLTRVLRQETPRTVALFTFPWGEMVSTDVRRALGLRRTEGEDPGGGWPA